MKRMLFNATYQGELRVATVDGQKLQDFEIETSSKLQRRGNIYKAVVTRVEQSLEACFVDYGMEKQGFLPFKDIDPKYILTKDGDEVRFRDINKITVGTELIVQVEKDERGNKGAALTSYITLPGRYLVLMPNNSKSGGVSRRIDGEEREELKTLISQLNIPQGMSIILRTAALGRDIKELEWDLAYLIKLWNAIKDAANQNKGAFLIYHESSLVIRSIRDHFTPEITEILIDTEEVYNQARSFMSNVIPNFVHKIKFYKNDVPLFSRFQVEHQIQSAYSREVMLPSGGVIVIDQGEALTAIDVNSAKANKGSDIEMTALNTNMEAAEEISRQLRLRDLAGLVVVDFIDMENPKNERDIENHFKHQLSFDKARIQMGKISKFGLLELSRQRLKSSLEETNRHSCPRCNGLGTIRGVESSALHILRLIEEDAVRNSNISALQVQLPVEVATYLLNERRDDVIKIETTSNVKVILIPNLHIESPNYKIHKVGNNNEPLSNTSVASYNMVDAVEDIEIPIVKAKEVKALVQNISRDDPAPIPSKGGIASFINKLSEFFKPKVEPIKKETTAKYTGVSSQVRTTSRNAKIVRNNKAIQTVRADNSEQTELSKNNTPRTNNRVAKYAEKPAIAEVAKITKSIPVEENKTAKKIKPVMVEKTERPVKTEIKPAIKEVVVPATKEIPAEQVISPVEKPAIVAEAKVKNNKNERFDRNPRNRQQNFRSRFKPIINDTSSVNSCNIAHNNLTQTMFISSFNGGISISSFVPSITVKPATKTQVNAANVVPELNLELVNTNPNLIKESTLEDITPTTNLKRYSDIVKPENNTVEQVYSQVETSN